MSKDYDNLIEALLKTGYLGKRSEEEFKRMFYGNWGPGGRDWNDGIANPAYEPAATSTSSTSANEDSVDYRGHWGAKPEFDHQPAADYEPLICECEGWAKLGAILAEFEQENIPPRIHMSRDGVLRDGPAGAFKGQFKPGVRQPISAIPYGFLMDCPVVISEAVDDDTIVVISRTCPRCGADVGLFTICPQCHEYVLSYRARRIAIIHNLGTK